MIGIKKIKNFLNYKKYINTNSIELRNKLLYSLKANELTRLTLKSALSGVTDEKYCDHNIIVSLTTYDKRLYDVYLAIESIMQGSIKPNRIILWLQEDMQDKILPRTLELQQKRGLEIMFCEDIRSYKKLIPSLYKFPDDAIITIDDDLIYEFDLLENLVTPYLLNPQYIYAHRCHKILTKKDGTLMKYNEWLWENIEYTPTLWGFPTGVGGTLYPPHSLDYEVFNRDVFMSICPFADDVWFKAMSLKKGTKVCSVFSHEKHGRDFLVNDYVQDIGLAQLNVCQNRNDSQIKAVFDKYDLYQYLK